MPSKSDATRNDDNSSRLITPSELGEILVISEREIVAYSRAGVLRRETQMHNKRVRVVYDWRENVRRYVLHQRQPREASRDDYQEEKRLTQQIVREQKQLELSIARGEMISRARVVLVMTNLLGQLKNHMLGLTARLFRSLIMQRDPAKIRAILDAGIRSCLIELNKFGSHSFDETSKNGATSDDNEAVTRVKARVAKRRRRKS